MAYETSSSLTYHLIVSYITTFIIISVGMYEVENINLSKLDSRDWEMKTRQKSYKLRMYIYINRYLFRIILYFNGTRRTVWHWMVSSKIINFIINKIIFCIFACLDFDSECIKAAYAMSCLTALILYYLFSFMYQPRLML